MFNRYGTTKRRKLNNTERNKIKQKYPEHQLDDFIMNEAPQPPEPTEWNCVRCKYTSKNKYNFYEHRLYRHREDVWLCFFCDIYFNSSIKLDVHLLQDHTNAEEKTRCVHCHHMCANAKSMNRHIQNAHKFIPADFYDKFMQKIDCSPSREHLLWLNKNWKHIIQITDTTTHDKRLFRLACPGMYFKYLKVDNRICSISDYHHFPKRINSKVTHYAQIIEEDTDNTVLAHVSATNKGFELMFTRDIHPNLWYSISQKSLAFIRTWLMTCEFMTHHTPLFAELLDVVEDYLLDEWDALRLCIIAPK